MIDFTLLSDDVDKDAEQAMQWCESKYESIFAGYFTEFRELFKRLSSKSHPITNDELQKILIELPIKLFDISEKVSNLKIGYEVAKMRLHEHEMELSDDDEIKKMKQTERKDIIQRMTGGDKLIIQLYATVIERVEREISFSRELIMGAKKVWDSRFKTDTVNPVSETDTELPAYSSMNKKSYIRGE